MAVNLSPLAGAGWQFFDNSGVILSGGRLYTYAAGTTTPQTTYTSSSGATPNANPIVLNSAGRIATDVWLTSTLTYKFVLKTSTGTTIGTYDNIPSVPSSVATDLTALQASVTALQAADLTFALKGANTDITSLASPALAGATATTQTAGNNTTKVATTAFVTTAVGSDIISFPDPTLAANAMTLPASTLPITLAFRSNVATTGLATTVTGTPAALVIPSGATLGTVNAIKSTIVEVLINYAGTLERAVVNLAGGNDLSETGLITTVAIDTAADSANVFYSTTARASVAYRVVRTITFTQATAGTWATAPSAVQGAGGNALTSMSSLGYGQTWQDVTASRAASTQYYNTTGKPIEVAITTNGDGNFDVNGVTYMRLTAGTSARGAGSLIIPPGARYSFTDTALYWSELR